MGNDHNIKVNTPYDEQAFKEMSPEARDWHIMSEIVQIKRTCVNRGVRISKVEDKLSRGRKIDTGLAAFMGLAGGAIATIGRKIFFGN